MRNHTIIFTLIFAFAIQGCGSSGGGGGGAGGDVSPANAPTNFTLSVTGPKSMLYQWDFVRMVDHFTLCEDTMGTSNYVDIEGATDILAQSHSMYIPVHKTAWGTAQITVDSCSTNKVIRLKSDPVSLTQPLSVAATGYFKASNTDVGDHFGYQVVLSADGSTLAVSANEESSSATGINGNQSLNNATEAGAVYIFVRSGNSWSQQAYIKASNTDAGDRFGHRLALSADGNTLAVSSESERSSDTGIDANQALNDAPNSGAVYIFTRTGATWSQQEYIKASNAEANDRFGSSLALSADGNTLAVGARLENSGDAGIGANQTLNNALFAGAAYVFTRSGVTWSQQEYIKASTVQSGGSFGFSVALSADGNTLAVGGCYESSSATGIDGNQTLHDAPNAGAVYIFTRSGATWSQEEYIKASNTEANDSFGWSLALSADGNTLVVGAVAEDSSATGIDGNQTLNDAEAAGAAYVFIRSGTSWSQQAYFKASNAAANHRFAHAVSLNSDGNTLAIAARNEGSSATGVNGSQGSGASDSGAAYVFTRLGATWSQQSYVKASNTGASDVFGESISLSADGDTLVVGAPEEDSPATGIGGSQGDGANFAGAAYLY